MGARRASWVPQPTTGLGEGCGGRRCKPYTIVAHPSRSWSISARWFLEVGLGDQEVQSKGLFVSKGLSIQGGLSSCLLEFSLPAMPPTLLSFPQLPMGIHMISFPSCPTAFPKLFLPSPCASSPQRKPSLLQYLISAHKDTELCSLCLFVSPKHFFLCLSEALSFFS